mmetsp:Transcript_14717/g.60116  ORF Transcript_14717/g.60116 Transcript_14717/m.60116 type:complete len:479 (-) Transcript_14717:2485-3921(-)
MHADDDVLVRQESDAAHAGEGSPDDTLGPSRKRVIIVRSKPVLGKGRPRLPHSDVAVPDANLWNGPGKRRNVEQVVGPIHVVLVADDDHARAAATSSQLPVHGGGKCAAAAASVALGVASTLPAPVGLGVTARGARSPTQKVFFDVFAARAAARECLGVSADGIVRREFAVGALVVRQLSGSAGCPSLSNPFVILSPFHGGVRTRSVRKATLADCDFYGQAVSFGQALGHLSKRLIRIHRRAIDSLAEEPETGNPTSATPNASGGGFKRAAAASTPDGKHLEVLDPGLPDTEIAALFERVDEVTASKTDLAADSFQSALTRVEAHRFQTRAAFKGLRLVAPLFRGPRSARRRGSVPDNLDVVLEAYGGTRDKLLHVVIPRGDPGRGRLVHERASEIRPMVKSARVDGRVIGCVQIIERKPHNQIIDPRRGAQPGTCWERGPDGVGINHEIREARGVVCRQNSRPGTRGEDPKAVIQHG